MMQYMLLKVGIAEIREVTDYYVRILYGWLYVCDGITALYWESYVWIWLHDLLFIVTFYLID